LESRLLWLLNGQQTESGLLGVGVWSLTETGNFLPPGGNPGASDTHPVDMPPPPPSIHVRNLLETAVLHLQHSPDLSEEDVRWIQQFAAHLITEFSVLKQRELLYAPLEDDSSEDQDGNLFDRVGTL
jgi:hypothetical protein